MLFSSTLIDQLFLPFFTDWAAVVLWGNGVFGVFLCPAAGRGGGGQKQFLCSLAKQLGLLAVSRSPIYSMVLAKMATAKDKPAPTKIRILISPCVVMGHTEYKHGVKHSSPYQLLVFTLWVA